MHEDVWSYVSSLILTVVGKVRKRHPRPASFITCATSFISSHCHCSDTISRTIISKRYFGRIFDVFVLKIFAFWT